MISPGVWAPFPSRLQHSTWTMLVHVLRSGTFAYLAWWEIAFPLRFFSGTVPLSSSDCSATGVFATLADFNREECCLRG